MSLRQIPILVLTCVSLAGFECVPQRNAEAYVALMAGQKARPLNGTFNNVPVLHSNQPEIVTGPGILVNTAAGSAIAAESNQPLRNAAHTFNGEFGVHMHHKYYPKDQAKLGGVDPGLDDPGSDRDESRIKPDHTEVRSRLRQKQF